MERKKITCPESAHLEEIELERTPFGIVLNSCSRFGPRCATQCEAECARRMDRRDRLRGVDRRERVLVIYADEQRIRPIANVIAATLEADGLAVELADADSGPAPPPASYEAVVIGFPVRFGRYRRAIWEYIRAHRDALASIPVSGFGVSRTGRLDSARLRRDTGLRPRRMSGFVQPRVWTEESRDRGAWTNQARAFALELAAEIPMLERR